MTASDLAKNNNSIKETKTEKFYMMLLRDMGNGPNYKAGALWPISGWPFYINGNIYGQRAGNGPDCGFQWTIGVDCVMVKRIRHQNVTETYEVA